MINHILFCHYLYFHVNIFLYQFQLIIAKEANNSDVQGRIDRKSLLRLISRLAKAGQINSIKTTIQADNRQKEVSGLLCNLILLYNLCCSGM